ncbi:MAG: hypothetical protein JRJ25_01410, partial [Deltaproteobacteria bacterium]|nr:hypothetical protein [Deltaproteobacteria bacterium]
MGYVSKGYCTEKDLVEMNDLCPSPIPMFNVEFRAYEETSNVEAAVRETLHSTGRALVITSMVLCGGFFIYTTSYLTNNIRFGLLTGCAVLFALAADFF